MVRAEHSKMALIYSQYLSNVQTFSYCHDTSIDEIDIGVIVVAQHIGGPLVIGRDRRLQTNVRLV